MSPHASEPDPPLHNAKARSLYRYLRGRLTDQETDEYFFKCREIADDLGMSSKEIGSLLGHLQDADLDIRVEKWSWARATTWRVRPQEA